MPYLNLQSVCEARSVGQGKRTAESDEMWDDTHGNHTAECGGPCLIRRSPMGGIKRIRVWALILSRLLGVLPLVSQTSGVFCFEAERAVHVFSTMWAWRSKSHAVQSIVHYLQLHSHPQPPLHPHPTHSPLPLYFLLHCTYLLMFMQFTCEFAY